MSNKPVSNLSSLLSDSAINLDAAPSTWQDAITQAGALLEHEGAIDPDYTAAMIQSVVDNGPYIVVAPGFAFAHARPSKAVHRTAISWLRLRKPLPFGHPKNDPVRLVVALAAADAHAHTDAMKDIARVLADTSRRRALDEVSSVAELRDVLGGATPDKSPETTTTIPTAPATSKDQATAESVESKGKILTVCGNGLGTSLFLKNTLDQVLDTWGWGGLVSTEATDTISAKGRAKEVDFLLTSAEIARTLGDVGVPVYVIDNFTSTAEVDRALRELYDI
jgi:posphotransferase system enzyme iiab component